MILLSDSGASRNGFRSDGICDRYGVAKNALWADAVTIHSLCSLLTSPGMEKCVARASGGKKTLPLNHRFSLNHIVWDTFVPFHVAGKFANLIGYAPTEICALFMTRREVAVIV